VPTPLRIGDDACAVLLEVHSKVVESNGHPVEEAQVWFRHNREGKADLHRVGTTDAKGQLVKQVCYQSTGDYEKAPPTGTVVLEFVITTFHYKDVEVHRTVKATSLLQSGLLFSQLRPLVPRKDLKPGAAFKVTIEAVLRDVA
jgi:hypothetical protein